MPTELTIAECEIAASLLLDKSNTQIAAERGTSPLTVATQVRAVFHKLEVNSRGELAFRS